MAHRMLFSLDRQFSFYYSFHQNRKNRLIHILSLPVLIFTVLVGTSYSFLPPPISLNVALVIAILYCAYVFFLDIYVGFVFMPYAALLYAAATVVNKKYAYHVAAPVALFFHILGWIAQLIGHYKFESRSPALLTSLVHAVMAAPFVTYLELLFSFGLMETTHKRLKNASVVRKVKNAQKAKGVKGAN